MRSNLVRGRSRLISPGRATEGLRWAADPALWLILLKEAGLLRTTNVDGYIRFPLRFGLGRPGGSSSTFGVLYVRGPLGPLARFDSVPKCRTEIHGRESRPCREVAALREVAI